LGLVFLSLAASAASAQKADWQAVKNLKSGKVVSIKTRHLTYAPWTTSRHASRAAIAPIPKPPGFSRNGIREIRLEHNQSKDAWIGVGALAGISLGASSKQRFSRGGCILRRHRWRPGRGHAARRRPDFSPQTSDLQAIALRP
jgi:hypothetical protein